MIYRFIVFQIILIVFFSSCQERTDFWEVGFNEELSEFKWSVKDINSDLPSDWSSFNYLTLELNASSPQHFLLKLFDAEGVRILQIHPFQNAWVRASIPLIHFQRRNVIGHDMAAISKTALPGLWIGFTGLVGTINQIDSIGVDMRLPIGNPTLKIRNIRLTQAPEDEVLSPLPVVDQFGQWISDDWPEKSNSFDELKAAWEVEEKELTQNLEINLSKYGGYLDDKVEATGFFRVEKINGNWWFVDPDGYLFFSVGCTGINGGGSFSRIEGREYIFESFPPDEFIETDRNINKASIYSWNLYRRFGAKWYEKWLDMTIKRMDAWGVNTVANWSDRKLCEIGQKPYVVALGGWGFNPNTMGMPDVYDPGYSAFIDSVAKKQCSLLKNDPWLLGYFVGNEPPWPGWEMELVNVILEGEDTPMKAELKKFLFNDDSPERQMRFIYNTYKKFITMVNTAIKKYDPNHLNLGLRFGGNPPEEIIKASADVGFDVFSLNIYGYSVNKKIFQKIDLLTGLPIIIGEFHFGTPGRGLAPGLAQTKNQKERGIAYRYYVENAAAHPSLVGTHWFQWWDQPSTGRFDGENYNIGFVDVTDQPYKEFIEEVIKTHQSIRGIHMGEIVPVDQNALVR